MASDGTRLAGLGCLRSRHGWPPTGGVEAECELWHCVDEEGRELRPGVTGRRKMGVKQAATLLDRSFLLYPVLPRPGAGGEGRARLLQTSDGSILGRDDDESKAASGGRRRHRKMRWGWCGCAVESFSEAADGDHVVASA